MRSTVGQSEQPRRWHVAVVVLAAVFLTAGQSVATAQQSDSKNIRQSAERILSSPEFRYFKRLERSGSRSSNSPGSLSARGNSSGSGDSSGGGRNGGNSSGGSGDVRNGGSRSSNSGSRNGNDTGAGGTGDGSTGNSGTGNSGSSGNADGGGDSGNGGEKGNGGNADAAGNSSPANAGGKNNPPPSPSAKAPAPSSTPSVALPSVGSSILSGLAWLLLLVVIGIILFLIFKAISNSDRDIQSTALSGSLAMQGEVEPDRAPGELPVDVYLAEARRLAGEGLYREAIAQLLLGAMSYVERAGLIQYRRGLTQRDYLRKLRREKEQYQAMKTMVRVYEPLGFGRRDPRQKHFEKSVAGYEQAFTGAAPGAQ